MIEAREMRQKRERTAERGDATGSPGKTSRSERLIVARPLKGAVWCDALLGFGGVRRVFNYVCFKI